MPKILFTKDFSCDFIEALFNNDFEIYSYNFIQTVFISLEKIQKQIDTNISNYIITSQKAANQINGLQLSGKFYCVGEKTAKSIQTNSNNIVLIAQNAKELIEKISAKKLANTDFIYFCSDIRRDEIPDGLHDLGHVCNEIITYCTQNKIVKLNQEFDAYVFFSPSGVKSLLQQYAIPKKAIIFAIGETTAKTIQEITSRKVLYPSVYNTESLIELIKNTFNAQK